MCGKLKEKISGPLPDVGGGVYTTLAEEKYLICLHSLLSLKKLLASHCSCDKPEVAQYSVKIV